ncbi:hypothetical protein CHS0354_028438 [Potamilus streckersoni]|uniref:Uncharacterized protein n=1 Tax=Potamilus streckersoni TaxID=2493646 RepID=A0AAE0VW40_9BIVA|nr:hypothetical protein CHS0354_028438 [Potamilus streckersoni]
MAQQPNIYNPNHQSGSYPYEPNYGPRFQGMRPPNPAIDAPWKAPMSGLAQMNVNGPPPMDGQPRFNAPLPGPPLVGPVPKFEPSVSNGIAGSPSVFQGQRAQPVQGNWRGQFAPPATEFPQQSSVGGNFVFINGPYSAEGDGSNKFVKHPITGSLGPGMMPPINYGQNQPSSGATRAGQPFPQHADGRGFGPPPTNSQQNVPSSQPLLTSSGQEEKNSGLVPEINTYNTDSSDDHPKELPVPFHGHAQYSHQVGMALTPSGLTPSNSGPPSQKSSRNSSPNIFDNSNYDALEGQFTGGSQGSSTPPVVSGQKSAGGTPTKRNQLPMTNMMPPGPPFSQQSPFVPLSVPGQPPHAGQPPQPGKLPPPPISTSQMPPSSHQPLFPGSGFPSPSSATQQSGLPPPPPSVNQQFGFPPTPSPINQQSRFPTPPSSNFQQSRLPAPTLINQRPGFSTPTLSTNQRPGFPPNPLSTPQQQGFITPPSSTNQQPGFPSPTSSTYQQPGFPPPSFAYQQPGFPATLQNQQTNPGYSTQVGFSSPSGQGQIGQYAQQPGASTYQGGVNTIASGMGSLTLQGGSSMVVNLLQQKKLIPPSGVETPSPKLNADYKKVNCDPSVFRCTMTSIPQTSSLLNKARLPLGILIHPFKDLSVSSLPVIQSSVIVRCKSCRTYINPFVYFVDQRRWKCNLCYKVNDLPDEFSFDPVTKTYGEPQRRPEIKSATIEFIAPSEYMLRPPQPAIYLFCLDVSFNAIETGYLTMFCQTLQDVIEKIPSDARTQVGFIAYDRAVHFFNLAEGLSQPQMLTVSDVDDVFLPCPDNLLVNLGESKELVIDLLNQLPAMFEGNMETSSALGATLQVAFKLLSPTGGRITVIQTLLPTAGPGALQNREDSSKNVAKDIQGFGPATDFYKKLALECSAQQVAVDLFLLNGQYADIASLECISKFSGGSVQYYPSFHAVRNPSLADKFEVDLRRYLIRKIGFEAVMRIRCTKGLSMHTFHGNFFVRSTDLLSLPNINPDAGFGMQMSIEDSLTETSTVCFQAALLYTSSKGERRIRVHTMCLPVTNQLEEIFHGADQQAIIGLLAKMASDRTATTSLSDARDALINAAVDILSAYGSTLPGSQRIGTLPTCHSLRLIPMYILAMLKHVAFRLNPSVKLDDRVFALQECKTLPLASMIQSFYPDLYPVHNITDKELNKKVSSEVPSPPLIHLSSANIDRNGAYLMDTGSAMYLYIGSAISEQFCKDVLDKPNFMSIEDGLHELPEVETEMSERLRNFLSHLLESRPTGATFTLVREDGKHRLKFFEYMVEDRTESSMSYFEFLQHLQKQMKS